MPRTYDSRVRIPGTGGAVFLGSDPIGRLLAAGHEMHCVGNLFTDTKRNIEHLHQEPPFEFMLRDFPPYVEVDEIYNPARPAIHPQTEDYWGNVNSIGPRSCYDEGRRCAEILFFDYHRQHGLEIKVARIFNRYRPRIHPADGRVVSNFEGLKPTATHFRTLLSGT